MARRYPAVLAAVAAAAICSGLLAAPTPAAAGAHRAGVLGGTWGIAKEVPGLAALNQGGAAQLSSVSCGAPGNCSAGGFYLSASGVEELFVVGQKHGSWGTAEEIPGLAALNQGVNAGFSSVSCASAGACSAGGYYTHADGSVDEQAFVVNESHGAWRKAEVVPGTAALSHGRHTETDSVSCPTAGNCTIGGMYWDGSAYQAFVAAEKNGTWGTAQQVPGVAGLNTGGAAQIISLSCASAGDCSAVGDYATSGGLEDAFAVTETNGTWGTAEEIPGTTPASHYVIAYVNSVSCASAGNCSAGGQYVSSAGYTYAYVVTERNGTWGTARRVPGLVMPQNKGAFASVGSVSCASAGNCSAAGGYTARSGGTQAFVVTEKDGHWATAQEIPGLATLNTGGDAAISSVSCTSAGTCGAVGDYQGSGGQEAFVVSEANGTWGTAKEVPGLAALNRDGAAVINSISCASADHCSAGGYYTQRNTDEQAFVVTES